MSAVYADAERRHRIGLIVPSSNTTMETELPAMFRAREAAFPEDAFTFHASRMRMRRVNEEELRAMNAQLGRASLEVADAGCDVVATACLVALMAQGPTYHCQAEQEIRDVLATASLEAPVVSSAGALLGALSALGASRIGVITPYMKPLTRLVCESLQSGGVTVQDALSLEVADNHAVSRLDPADLRDHWRKLDLVGCDALVLSACVQMPSLAMVEEIEQACGVPTITAATATAFALLEALGLDPMAPHSGQLLSGRVASTRPDSIARVDIHVEKSTFSSGA